MGVLENNSNPISCIDVPSTRELKLKCDETHMGREYSIKSSCEIDAAFFSPSVSVVRQDNLDFSTSLSNEPWFSWPINLAKFPRASIHSATGRSQASISLIDATICEFVGPLSSRLKKGSMYRRKQKLNINDFASSQREVSEAEDIQFAVGVEKRSFSASRRSLTPEPSIFKTPESKSSNQGEELRIPESNVPLDSVVKQEFSPGGQFEASTARNEMCNEAIMYPPPTLPIPSIFNDLLLQRRKTPTRFTKKVQQQEDFSGFQINDECRTPQPSLSVERFPDSVNHRLQKIDEFAQLTDERDCSTPIPQTNRPRAFIPQIKLDALSKTADRPKKTGKTTKRNRLAKHQELGLLDDLIKLTARGGKKNINASEVEKQKSTASTRPPQICNLGAFNTGNDVLSHKGVSDHPSNVLLQISRIPRSQHKKVSSEMASNNNCEEKQQQQQQQQQQLLPKQQSTTLHTTASQLPLRERLHQRTQKIKSSTIENKENYCGTTSKGVIDSAEQHQPPPHAISRSYETFLDNVCDDCEGLQKEQKNRRPSIIDREAVTPMNAKSIEMFEPMTAPVDHPFSTSMLEEPYGVTPRTQQKKTPRDIITPQTTTTPSKKNFKSRRADLSQYWFNYFNEKVFKCQLPRHMELIWNPRLTRTAGQTMMRKKSKANGDTERTCIIHLSTKVLDTEQRLIQTLLHELCHVGQFLLEKESKPAHGPGFQKWSRVAGIMCPEYPVSVTHNYDIFQPYRYECVKCHNEIGRHSKIPDLKKVSCGNCEGEIRFVGQFKEDGTPATITKASPYNLYVKANFAKIKSQNPFLDYGSIMTLLAAQWKQVKNNQNEIQTTNDATDDLLLDQLSKLKLNL